jgi:hypothetical protein
MILAFALFFVEFLLLVAIFTTAKVVADLRERVEKLERRNK